MTEINCYLSMSPECGMGGTCEPVNCMLRPIASEGVTKATVSVEAVATHSPVVSEELSQVDAAVKADLLAK